MKLNLPQKANSRITINAFMVNALFVILTLMLTLGNRNYNTFMLAQLVLAIPLLFISSMFYAKASYRKEKQLFDHAAWLTSTIGNNFILNAVGLIASTFSRTIAYIYFGLAIVLITTYYGINIYYHKDPLKEDLLKILLIILILAIGGVYPLLIG